MAQAALIAGVLLSGEAAFAGTVCYQRRGDELNCTDGKYCPDKLDLSTCRTCPLDPTGVATSCPKPSRLVTPRYLATAPGTCNFGAAQVKVISQIRLDANKKGEATRTVLDASYEFKASPSDPSLIGNLYWNDPDGKEDIFTGWEFSLLGADGSLKSVTMQIDAAGKVKLEPVVQELAKRARELGVSNFAKGATEIVRGAEVVEASATLTSPEFPAPLTGTCRLEPKVSALLCYSEGKSRRGVCSDTAPDFRQHTKNFSARNGKQFDAIVAVLNKSLRTRFNAPVRTQPARPGAKGPPVTPQQRLSCPIQISDSDRTKTSITSGRIEYDIEGSSSKTPLSVQLYLQQPNQKESLANWNRVSNATFSFLFTGAPSGRLVASLQGFVKSWINGPKQKEWIVVAPPKNTKKEKELTFQYSPAECQFDGKRLSAPPSAGAGTPISPNNLSGLDEETTQSEDEPAGQ